MIQKGDDMRLYECVFIIRQDLSSAQVDSITAEFCAIITDHKGAVKKQEYWGLKTMAYKIKKNRKGHYVMLNFEADGVAVAELDRRLGLNEDVLRSLITSIEAIDPEPSIMMKNTRERAGNDAPATDDDAPATATDDVDAPADEVDVDEVEAVEVASETPDTPETPETTENPDSEDNHDPA